MKLHNHTTTLGLDFLFDTIRNDLMDLHPADRLVSAARMLGRQELVSNSTFRQTFSDWRRTNDL